MQLPSLLLTGFALALLKRGHEVAAAASALLAAFVMLFAFADSCVGH
jgi:hypothetical protein